MTPQGTRAPRNLRGMICGMDPRDREIAKPTNEIGRMLHPPRQLASSSPQPVLERTGPS